MSTSNPTRHGDETELYSRHHDRIVNQLAARYGVSREQTEDAVQFAFVQLLAHQPDRDSFDVAGWLYTTAKHELLSILRRQQREEATEDHVMAAVPAIATLQEVTEARDALALVGQLKPQQAQVLRLRIAGLSYREICQHTGRTYTWVNRHNAEGLAALRKLMDAEGGE